jgi:hypothetical protein
MSYIGPLVDMAEAWARSDGEDSNFLYALTPMSRLNLTHTLANVFDVSVADVEENGRRFLFFKEEPAQHWYPGAGIGFSYPR